MEEHRKVIKNNKFKILQPTWDEKFMLPESSYSIPGIQNYFEYIIKKHETLTDNPSIRIYVDITENRITFKTKTGYYAEFSKVEKMKLLGSKEKRNCKHKNDEGAPRLEFSGVVPVHCNVVNNAYQRDSRNVYTSHPINHLEV